MSNKNLAFIEYLPTDENYLQNSEIGSHQTVVLLHGLFGSARNLSGIAKHLSRYYRVIAFDLPNHGDSPHTSEMTIASMAEHVLSEIHDRALEKVNLIGHSLGGKVAMALALTYPAIVEKLVVADMAPVDYKPQHNHILKALSELPLATMKSRSEADKHLSQSISDLRTRQFLIQNVNKGDSGFKWRINLPVIIENYNLLSKGFKLSQNIRPFEKPTLFVGGEKSNYIQPVFEEHMRSLFPFYEYQEVANAGHWLHVENPDQFNQFVSQFMMKTGVN